LQVASQPRLFGQSAYLDPAATPDVRQHLADWLAAKDNPFFARNFANRYWSYLLGRGLVEPIDDMRATNPPTNPALLAALAKDFADHNYDAKHLLRTIATSRVYQLSTDLAPELDKDAVFFTHHVPRRMPAECCSTRSTRSLATPRLSPASRQARGPFRCPTRLSIATS
jgi:hypothetical protein